MTTTPQSKSKHGYGRDLIVQIDFILFPVVRKHFNCPCTGAFYNHANGCLYSPPVEYNTRRIIMNWAILFFSICISSPPCDFRCHNILFTGPERVWLEEEDEASHRAGRDEETGEDAVGEDWHEPMSARTPLQSGTRATANQALGLRPITYSGYGRCLSLSQMATPSSKIETGDAINGKLFLPKFGCKTDAHWCTIPSSRLY